MTIDVARQAGFGEVRGIPRLRSARKIHKFLHQKLHAPRTIASDLVSLLSFVRNPSQHFIRSGLAPDLDGKSGLAGKIPRDTAYWAFGPDELPGLRKAVAVCREAYDRQSEPAETSDVPLYELSPTDDKEFRSYVLSGTGFAYYPDVLGLAISKPVLECVTSYLGWLPVLSNAYLYLTRPNDTVVQSQQYHLDFDGKTGVKLFVNVFDTDADCGPFTFIPADTSEPVCRRLRYHEGRLEDEEIDEAGGQGRSIQLTGPSGSGAFVDTLRCLHFGSRQNRKDRLMLQFKYNSFYAPEARPINWAKLPATFKAGLTPTERLVLGLR